MRAAILTALGLAALLAACSGRDEPRRAGIVVVAARTAPRPAVPTPALPPVSTASPLQASAVLEAAVPATTELAALAIEQEVGVLVTAQKARDPFRMADIDLNAASES